MIVDDHPMVREGLEAMLTVANFDVVASVQSGEEALSVLPSLKNLDVVIMDIRMPGGKSGFETLVDMRRQRPELNVLLMAGMPLADEIALAKKRGARGYLPKTMKPRELVVDIRRICADADFFAEEEYREPESPLTTREMDVLKYIADGKSLEEVSTILNISHETVKTHAKSIRFKLNASTMTLALATAFRQGILRT